MVIEGVFGPGTRVAEIPLAERLGVSRTPVRAALAILEREGLLVSAPRRGFTVREITAGEIVDAFEVRGALEGLACRIAIEKGVSADALTALGECVQEGERLLAKGLFGESDTQNWSAMNERFHAVIVQAGGNVPLANALAYNNRLPLVPAGAIAFHSTNLELAFGYMKHAQAEHADIHQALVARQAARAEALVREHSYKSGQNLRKLLEDTRRLADAGVPGLRLVVG